MPVNDTTKIVLGSLRYKASPNTVLSVNVDLNQNEKELIEFDRNVDLSLQQVFSDERQTSTIFRPVTKYSVIFKNTYTGSFFGKDIHNILSLILLEMIIMLLDIRYHQITI